MGADRDVPCYFESEVFKGQNRLSVWGQYERVVERH
jgi:hypothetical protein